MARNNIRDRDLSAVMGRGGLVFGLRTGVLVEPGLIISCLYPMVCLLLSAGQGAGQQGVVLLLLVPSMAAGNMMVKSLLTFTGARMVGVVTGAKRPIALNSRSASFEEKYNSLLGYRPGCPGAGPAPSPAGRPDWRRGAGWAYISS